jgi:hypothetical protein
VSLGFIDDFCHRFYSSFTFNYSYTIFVGTIICVAASLYICYLLPALSILYTKSQVDEVLKIKPRAARNDGYIVIK